MERIEIRCDGCGLIFEKQNYNQHYCCDECRRQGYLKKQRERYRQQKALKQKMQKNKKPTLSEINQRARAAGMTYGKYMAQEYGKQVKVERRKENV